MLPKINYRYKDEDQIGVGGDLFEESFSNRD
jgi:hypothetical protein